MGPVGFGPTMEFYLVRLKAGSSRPLSDEPSMYCTTGLCVLTHTILVLIISPLLKLVVVHLLGIEPRFSLSENDILSVGRQVHNWYACQESNLDN